MPKVMKTCRVCGRSYEACRTVNKALGVFRWQDVACSPECGSIYLQKLNESRGVHTEGTVERPVEAPATESYATHSDEEPNKRTARPARRKKAKDTGVVPLRLEADSEDADVGND